MSTERIPCERAAEMLRNLKRTARLPPFDSEGMNDVVNEINALHQHVIDTINDTTNEERKRPEISANILVHHSCMHRNKRCMLVYLMYRFNKIKELRWETGGSVLPPETRESLSALELECFQSYDHILAEYMASVDLDLTVDLLRPPKDLFIEVRVKKDHGEIVLESGQTVNLRAHTTHFLRRTDVETLIRQGILEHIV
eukprot:TRINITY_DN229_c0_g1_i1.p1 TRINITY_DN229_c0_g1~~TRINITY_DN229_c0_g1_i1.p1  ORF type:complete len:199 (+),score=25.73 TRINITY_DN229_c0_g1_i1:231-827(+)